MANQPLDVFVSYSHKDTAVKDNLRAHLSILVRTNRIRLWDDKAIMAGDHWERSIVDHLLSAQIVLLLISSDFIDSDYCYLEEMRRAGERHAQGETVIVPVIVRDCIWKSLPLIDEHRIQAIPRSLKPVFDSRSGRVMDDVLKEVVDELKTLVDSLAAHRSTAAPAAASGTAGRTTQPAIPSLVADLCDRSPQDEVFAEALRASLRVDKPRRPFVFVIHGDDEQRHLGLESRLAYIHVSRRAQVPVEQVTLENPGLAYVTDPSTAFMAQLGDQLLDDRGATLGQLVNYISGHEPILLLRSLFDESRDPPERVRRLIPAMLSVWNEWPDLPQNKILLHGIWIRFDHKDDSGRGIKAGRKNVRDFLRQLWNRDSGFKDNERVAGAVLPELQSVHQADVLDWTGKRDVRRFADILPEDVKELYQQAAPSNADGRIPMEPLHKAIYQLAVAKRKW